MAQKEACFGKAHQPACEVRNWFMSEIPHCWPELYREARLESDPRKAPVRIEEARKAIQRRAHELWGAGLATIKEQRELDAALHFLDLLKMVGPSEAELAALKQ